MNVVTACRACNHRKGNRTPEQARMRLVCEPREPSANPYRVVYRHFIAGPPKEWLLYLPG